jgi:hypothetical protein
MRLQEFQPFKYTDRKTVKGKSITLIIVGLIVGSVKVCHKVSVREKERSRIERNERMGRGYR